MTSWQCRFCYTWDSVQTIHCSTCNCHWKQAQLKRSKSRRFSSCLFSVAFEGKRMSIGTLKTNWSVRDGKSIAYPLTFVCVVSILIWCPKSPMNGGYRKLLKDMSSVPVAVLLARLIALRGSCQEDRHRFDLPSVSGGFKDFRKNSICKLKLDQSWCSFLCHSSWQSCHLDYVDSWSIRHFQVGRGFRNLHPFGPILWSGNLLSCAVFPWSHSTSALLEQKWRNQLAFWLLRLPEIRHALRHHGDQGRSHPKLRGQDQHGCFKTSWAKIYPEGLNKILATETCNFAKDLRACGSTDRFESYPTFFLQFQTEDSVGGHVVQRDYRETLYRWHLPVRSQLSHHSPWISFHLCFTSLQDQAFTMQSSQSVKSVGPLLFCLCFWVVACCLFGLHFCCCLIHSQVSSNVLATLFVHLLSWFLCWGFWLFG